MTIAASQQLELKEINNLSELSESLSGTHSIFVFQNSIYLRLDDHHHIYYISEARSIGLLNSLKEALTNYQFINAETAAAKKSPAISAATLLSVTGELPVSVLSLREKAKFYLSKLPTLNTDSSLQRHSLFSKIVNKLYSTQQKFKNSLK